MRIIEVIIEDVDPIGANITVEDHIEGPSKGGRGQQNNYRGQFQGNCGQFNPSHGSYSNYYYGNYQGRGGRCHGGNFHRPWGCRRGNDRGHNNYQYHQYYMHDD